MAAPWHYLLVRGFVLRRRMVTINHPLAIAFIRGSAMCAASSVIVIHIYMLYLRGRDRSRPMSLHAYVGFIGRLVAAATGALICKSFFPAKRNFSFCFWPNVGGKTVNFFNFCIFAARTMIFC